MNWRAVRAIMRKDIQVAFQNKGVIIPLVAVPLILLVLIPALVALVPVLDTMAPSAPTTDLDQFVSQMPAGLRTALDGYTPEQQLVVILLVYLFAPLYLILPLMVASVIAADSFAGEKERKTLEALLYTPTTNGELLLGKMLGAWVPALLVSWVGFALYSLVANLAAWPTVQEWLLPNPLWWILVIWVAPAAAGFGLITMVLVSLRAEGFQDAYQLGGVVVLPLVLLIIGQAMGVIYFSLALVLLLGGVLWLLNLALFGLGRRLFQRSRLIARLA
jgi:ABC-type Na+ efflux pump permease subunit